MTMTRDERIENARKLVAEHGCGLNPENAQAVLDRLGELEGVLKLIPGPIVGADDAHLLLLSNGTARKVAACLRAKGDEE